MRQRLCIWDVAIGEMAAIIFGMYCEMEGKERRSNRSRGKEKRRKKIQKKGERGDNGLRYREIKRNMIKLMGFEKKKKLNMGHSGICLDRGR